MLKIRMKKNILIKIREKVGIDHHNDRRAYTENTNEMHDGEYNLQKYW